jgi:hypothetical protein
MSVNSDGKHADDARQLIRNDGLGVSQHLRAKDFNHASEVAQPTRISGMSSRTNFFHFSPG